MKVLHVTFRYGKETYGGAELHMRKLSEELLKKGVKVDICTTKTNGLRPLVRSGTIWDNSLESESIGGIDVYRFPVKGPNKYVAIVIEKALQGRLDREEDRDEKAILGYMEQSFDEKGAVLLGGWNHLERYGASAMRWTRRNSSLLINDEHIRRVSIAFSNPKKIRGKLELRSEGFERSVPISGMPGPETISVDVPDVTGKLFAGIKLNRSWSKLADHRSMGIYVSGISYEKTSPVIVDMEYDYRKFLIKKGAYIDHMYRRASSRPMFYCRLFDYMRGPDSPAMLKWLKKHVKDYDVVMAQMFPFNTVGYASLSKDGRPLAITPLMHVDDDFYHWPHYYRYLAEAECVFAMSGHSKASLFDRLTKNAMVIGAGVDEKLYAGALPDGKAFRKKYGLEGKKLILTVSRKSPGKRYDLLVKAVERIGDEDVRLIMIGPDEDNVPIGSARVSYLGKVSDEDLREAYDACDVFAMMSESESFGMVFCEAWSRKKPVIGNVYCGAVAALIDDGVDGFLCGSVDDTAEKISRLLSDKALSERLGSSGFNKVMENYTWDKVAEKAYACYKGLSGKN